MVRYYQEMILAAGAGWAQLVLFGVVVIIALLVIAALFEEYGDQLMGFVVFSAIGVVLFAAVFGTTVGFVLGPIAAIGLLIYLSQRK